MKEIFNRNIFIARERRTFQVLLLIVMVLLGLNFSLPLIIKRHAFDYSEFESEIENYKRAQVGEIATSAQVEVTAFDVNKVSSAELEQYGLPKSVADRWIKYREAIGGFASVEQVEKIYGLNAEWYQRNLEKLILIKKEAEVRSEDVTQAPVTLFSFDPNTVTDDDLDKLGFSPKARKSLINYRNKGGTFYKADELKFLFGMDGDFFDRIANYVAIDTAILPQVDKEMERDSVEPIARPELVASQPIDVDINNSNVYQWQMLKGIGAKYAARIINYRERLGGFTSVQQVAETYNIPDSVFQAIKPYLTISPIKKPILINTISVDSLRLHPYVDWKQASIIVNYRKQHGHYQTPEDLLKTRVFDTAFVKRIEPYLVFSGSGE